MEKEMMVYYQIGEHKMKSSVFAKTPAIAEQMIRLKIKILKIEEVKSPNFDSIFGEYFSK